MKNSKKTVLFLCNCGTNIANFIDMEDINKWAKENPDLSEVITHNLLCSPDGKKFFSETISDLSPDEIVIAACSPKMHEHTFRKIAEDDGFNIARVNMANIREHCAWVTPDRERATRKTKSLIGAAIRRSACNEDLEKKSIECLTDVLIIGGGIAGIEAAITASRAERKVYIVEKEISLGGNIIKSEEVAPAMECAPCLLAPRLSIIRDDPNINVISNAQVTLVKGFSGNFNVTIEKKARFVEDNCIGCEACFDACPVSVKNKFHLDMGERKAIYTLFPGSVPAAAVIDRDNCKHFIDGSCDACVPACPFESINFEQKDETIEVDVGAIVLATGLKTGDPSGIEKLGYGKLDNVITISEFERMASTLGPTGGKIKLKDGNPPSSVAVIHCAGSLRNDAIPYCSGICCTTASKVGDLLRKHNPDTKVYNIHNDLVFSTPSEHSFFMKQVEAGTNFIKTLDLTSLEVSEKENHLAISVTEGEIEVDMVVLATGLLPSDDTVNIAKLLHLDVNKSGFFEPGHQLLHPTGASLDGIYIAGCAAGPCNVATSVTQGHAAVGDAISRLIPGKKIDLEVMTSVIDEDICSGCKLCISVCPYNSISFDEEKNICSVIEAICRGCGTCTASCPGGASKAKHFTDEQIYAEIGGLLNE